MSEINEAVEKILLHKANLIENSDGHKKHAKSVLKEHGIISSETSREEVKVLVKVFKMGAVDAMVYDVGSALALGRRDDVENWTLQANRAHIIRKKFLEG